MAKSQTTYEKKQREKAKRDKRQQKLESKKNKEKEEQINIEDMSPEEFIQHYNESIDENNQNEEHK